ncbi:MAG TPA: single-stranded-DNA-specific exonuclease RecJ [Terriglobales bacterium]|nr:single-stranded-DNA-specific exonuclease RecJ [Terriglobales bacterium]
MRWNLRSVSGMEAQRLADEAGISPTLARLLLLRGVAGAAEAQRFLSPLLSHLHSPYAMSGMAAAVERLRAALERKEKILIYGDYDVDGTTAIVILVTAIRLCGGEADFHVPHRIREGYGMKDDVIERAASEGVRLIVSVDTGIRAFDAAQTARRVGVDLIVTDHHLPHEGGVPEALVVLNPNQPGCQYPCKDLCGAGVAFKLAHALMEKALPDGRKLQPLLESFLKPLAIATIADAVPLVDENRVFASLGLAGLRSPVNVGLKALLEVAQLDGSRPLNGTDVAFRLAPRLNAAGRMDVARDVIELFTTKDMVRAREIAERLNQLNSERQAEEARIVEEICRTLDDSPERREAYCIVVDGEAWHRGVIGIAATRVVERYCRPALVISRLGDEAHGSGRSIPAFHLLNALESCQELFSRYGGHAHAVGFALPAERVPQLRSAMDAYARTQLTPADFEPILNLDAELGLAKVTPELYDALCQLEPFGLGNPEPRFLARNVRVLLPARIIKDKHIKMKLAVEQNGRKFATGIPAIGWGMAERLRQEQVLAGDVLDVAFTLEHNHHPEFGGLELRLCDVVRVGKAAVSVGSAAGTSGRP